MIKTQIITLVLFGFSLGGFAVKPKNSPNKSCQQITKTCESAGFVANEWKKGIGLYAHCVNPLMQGLSEVKGAKKPLPKVDPTLIEACRTENPNFGMPNKK